MTDKSHDKAPAKWDGKERRAGIVDRRGAGAPKPFEEYPKMLDGGVIVKSAEEEKGAADAKKAGEKAAADAAKDKK